MTALIPTAGTLAGRLPTGEPVAIGHAEGIITSVEPIPEEAGLPTLLPGLFDLQVNGYGGHDVNEPDLHAETVRALAAALRERGTTRFCPTLITGSEQRLIGALRVIAQARRDDPQVAAAIPCVNIEGPSLSGLDGPRGAHDPRWIRPPSIAEFDRWQDASEGLVGIVTIAPEWPGAPEWIHHAVASGTRVAIGHSAATGEQVTAAVDAGASLSTHLGNGVAATLPRHPNLVWTQLADDRLTALLIGDGHHLPRDTFTVMVRAKGAQRCVLTSDSVALAGLPPGGYTTPVGGRVSIEPDGSIRLAGSPLLAGSGACLLECVRWAIASGAVTTAQAAAMATTQPAAVLGVRPSALEVGAPADIVLL